MGGRRHSAPPRRAHIASTPATSLPAAHTPAAHPAQRTIRDNFNKLRGDVMYGLAKPRAEYMRRFLTGRATESDYFTIDQYNEHVPEMPTYDATKDGEIEDPLLLAGIRRYRDALQNQRPEVGYLSVGADDSKARGELTEEDRARLAAKADKLRREDGGDPTQHESFDPYEIVPREKRSFRLASKFGIDHFIRATNATIHFVLDGDRGRDGDNRTKLSLSEPETWDQIDMSGVVPKPGPGEPKTSITASELRYIYRHWDDLKDTGRIKFYEKGNEVPPPWEQPRYKRAWEQYEQQRQAKHAGEV